MLKRFKYKGVPMQARLVMLRSEQEEPVELVIEVMGDEGASMRRKVVILDGSETFDYAAEFLALCEGVRSDVRFIEDIGNTTDFLLAERAEFGNKQKSEVE